jgi:iron-sulfur cluster assembly protein
MNETIIFTATASDYVKSMLEKKNGVGLRLTIKKTGCSGYSYAPTILQQENVDDMVITLQNNVKIFIDKTWLHLLEGILVDYVEDLKSGIKQKKLTFTNPNEATRCGCGESFHVS